MNPESQKQYEDEIDLRELFSTLWKGKWIIASVTTVFSLIAVVVMLMTPDQYRSTVVLVPAHNGSSSMMAGLSSKLTGLASLAGVNVGSGGGDESQVAIEIMKSWGFVDKFIKEQGIEVEIFAATKWDADTNKLFIDDGLYDTEGKNWVSNSPSGETVEPTSWDLYESFNNRLTISQMKDTGLISVSIEYYSPTLAKQWVDLYVELINSYMRERKLKQVERNIEYLQSQINKTSIAEMKEVFYNIVEEQIKSKMLAEASPEYAFLTVSEAMVAEKKSKPARGLISLFGAVLGMFIGLLIVLFKKYGLKSS